jgi:hypothetical protein
MKEYFWQIGCFKVGFGGKYVAEKFFKPGFCFKNVREIFASEPLYLKMEIKWSFDERLLFETAISLKYILFDA